MGMYTISDTMHVNAPIERCFLLATSIDLVARSLEMRPVSGRLTGLIQDDDRLVWRGWKFGLPQMHETIITGYDRPHFFQDTQGRGRFKRFQHDHTFTEIDDHTLLQDKIRFILPFGWLGDLVAKHILVPYIAGVLHRRFQMLKRVAEGDEWHSYLPEQGDQGPAFPAESSGQSAQTRV
jgi:ligand-binding SRPBCC domain-containing protein